MRDDEQKARDARVKRKPKKGKTEKEDREKAPEPPVHPGPERRSDLPQENQHRRPDEEGQKDVNARAREPTHRSKAFQDGRRIVRKQNDREQSKAQAKAAAGISH